MRAINVILVKILRKRYKFDRDASFLTGDPADTLMRHAWTQWGEASVWAQLLLEYALSYYSLFAPTDLIISAYINRRAFNLSILPSRHLWSY